MRSTAAQILGLAIAEERLRQERLDFRLFIGSTPKNHPGKVWTFPAEGDNNNERTLFSSKE